MAASPDASQALIRAGRMAVVVLAALVFARAGALKLRAGRSLAGVVDNYDLLPSFMAPVVAAVLPMAEIALAAALALTALWSAFRPAGLGAWVDGAAAALLLVFALAMAINLARGRGHIDCGCGDVRSRQTLRWGLVLRNLALAAALIVAALAVQSAGSGVRLAAVEPDGALLGFVAGGAAFLLLLCQEAFAALPLRARSAPLPPPDPRLGFAVHQRTGAAR